MLTVSTAARAEHEVDLTLKTGAVLSGQLVEYVPGDHVTLTLEHGERVRITSADAASIHFGSEATGSNAKSAPAQSTEASAPTPATQNVVPDAAATVRLAAVQALIIERVYWKTRPRAIAPAALMLVGTGMCRLGLSANLSPWLETRTASSPRSSGLTASIRF